MSPKATRHLAPGSPALKVSHRAQQLGGGDQPSQQSHNCLGREVTGQARCDQIKLPPRVNSCGEASFHYRRVSPSDDWELYGFRIVLELDNNEHLANIGRRMVRDQVGASP
jgi:hypothetical protein